MTYFNAAASIARSLGVCEGRQITFPEIFAFVSASVYDLVEFVSKFPREQALELIPLLSDQIENFPIPVGPDIVQGLTDADRRALLRHLSAVFRVLSQWSVGCAQDKPTIAQVQALAGAAQFGSRGSVFANMRFSDPFLVDFVNELRTACQKAAERVAV